jgi:hypothetical protein
MSDEDKYFSTRLLNAPISDPFVIPNFLLVFKVRAAFR